MPDDLSKFKKVEGQLNQLTFKGAEIGSLLSKYHTLGYLNSLLFDSNLKYIFSIIRITIMGFLKPLPKADREKRLFLNKLSNRPQCNALIDPIFDEFKDIALLYSPDDTSEIDYNFSRRLNFKILFNVGQYLYSKLSSIINLYNANNIKTSKCELWLFLYLQLIAYSNWVEYFKNSRIVLLVTDFDRDYRTAPMVLAARKNNVTSVTLVHGVLNPPFAYVPIIADQVWCWGNFQREQLISYGVPKEKIQVVGNPIAIEYRNKVREIHGDGKVRIGIGLNPMSMEENIHFLDLFRTYFMHKSFSWIVKLHPSMKKSEWMKKMETSNFKFYENGELDNRSFFNEIDLLVVSNSGIGYEAVVNNIPIWVYRILGGQYGHDGVMIELGRCPEINSHDILNKEMRALQMDKKKYLETLLLREEGFVRNKFYVDIGENATNNIINLIKSELVDAV